MTQTIMITGANRGIGFEMVRQVVERGDSVIACCRAPPHASDLVAFARAHPTAVTVLGLNVSSEGDVASVAAALNRGIDLLVCNAGVLFGRGGLRDAAHNAATVEDSLMTNIAGVFFTVKHFLPHLLTGAKARKAGTPGKIAVISSNMGSSTRSGSNALIYRASKAAATNLARSMAVELAPENIAVGAYHPGWVRTDMGGATAAITPQDSVAGLLARFAELCTETSGVFEDYRGAPLPF